MRKKIIVTLGILFPIIIAVLTQVKIEGYSFSFLPKIYAILNALTAFGLIVAFIAIKNKKVLIHELIIDICMLLSMLFLLFYLIYHMTSTPTKYLGDYPILYYVILISHILLSTIVIPLVLFSFMYGKEMNINKHKKIVKFAFPIWLYVALTGVIIYFMISPYYV